MTLRVNFDYAATSIAHFTINLIGLFVGIDLIFYGCAWIALALSLRTM
jgi:uncharacterized membrane protein HdeD (DUF308 family)